VSNQVVAVVPHPDDESYAFAGTLAALIERGQNRDLGVTRAAELRGSCAAIGARLDLLELPDGGLSEHEIDLTPHLAPDDVVLTLGEDGAYGHPDHLACTRMVGAAIGKRTLLHAAFPPGLFAPVHRAIGRHVKLALAVDELGTSRDDVDHVVDVRPYRPAKLASLAAHTSQLRDGDPLSFLGDGWVAPLLDEEWLVHVSGPRREGLFG